MMRFAAGCCTDHEITGQVPQVFENLGRGVAFAKEGKFRDALWIIGDVICRHDFLRSFAQVPRD
jgi:hypothetical protein